MVLSLLLLSLLNKLDKNSFIMKVTSYTYKHTLCLNGLINCLIEIQMIVDRECLGALSAATC